MTTLAWPGAGGEDQETLAHASGRAAEVLHAHERLVDLAQQSKTNTLDQIDRARVRELRTPTNAVSVLDLERMALDVPGTRVARARAWPGVHGRFSCLSAPGSVTLVVIPDLQVTQPQPSAGLLRALKKYLNRRRMVTTMLDVVGPMYLAVSVSATVHLRRGAGPAEVNGRIEQALNTFLNPLRGGPDGRGWPFGRPVYRAEILQLIDGVPGVDHVSDLALFAEGGSPQCGNLTLCPTWLVAAASHDIRIE
jgi:predicted phage baseplate assembly protein